VINIEIWKCNNKIKKIWKQNFLNFDIYGKNFFKLQFRNNKISRFQIKVY